MKNDLLDKLVDKSITKEELFKMVKANLSLLPDIINGVSSEKAAIRYGCGKVLMDLSEEYPKKIYPHMDFFIALLDSKYRILTWQTMFIIANLTKVDTDKKFDLIFDKFYSFINNDYMVTVANIVGHSGKIALAKPYLIPQITKELLKVEKIKTTPHLTVECKKVIAEGAIQSFDMFFPQVKNKDEVISFVKKYTDSSRKTLKAKSLEFLSKWNV
ncbi:hypothetical protein AYK24_00850 [Thermoplasmatales archaeon SG8-52-4]|nr:MAG: hypothetical protein AYK24_00850 [Thermoplasmatales archaeon SG8-52-4]